MSSYPGDDQQAQGEPPSDHEPATEPTQPEAQSEPQPEGYWERQAADRAREQQAGRDRTDYPAAGSTPPPYSAPPFNPPPFNPAQSAGPYGAPPFAGYPPQYTAQPPDHPQSTLAMILGIVGLVGALFLCGVPLVVSPFAWAIGRNALKEIRASQGQLGGESQARAGMIMGIIGTVLMVLALLAIIVLVLFFITTQRTVVGSSI